MIERRTNSLRANGGNAVGPLVILRFALGTVGEVKRNDRGGGIDRKN